MEVYPVSMIILKMENEISREYKYFNFTEFALVIIHAALIHKLKLRFNILESNIIAFKVQFFENIKLHWFRYINP